VESLSGYVNRLAWLYRVSPQVLVGQEIVPLLRRTVEGRSTFRRSLQFCIQQAISINGAGEDALDWVHVVEQLTVRTDLGNLTLQQWASGAPSIGLLRKTPAWCPVCYHEWRESGLVVYQPLIWMLPIMQVCPKHWVPLENRCPYCNKDQHVITFKLEQGYCRHCGKWLGKPVSEFAENNLDKETFRWQKWVTKALEQLYRSYKHSSELSWEKLLLGLTACKEAAGGARTLARLTNLSKSAVLKWLHGKAIPSLEAAFRVCYALDILPFQLMTSDALDMRGILLSKKRFRSPRPKRHALPTLNLEKAREVIQIALDDQLDPISLNEVARRLRAHVRTLRRLFPHECDLVAARYKNFHTLRREARLTQACEEVYQIARSLHSDGIFPGARRIKAKLSDPHVLCEPAVRAALRSVRCELGIKLVPSLLK
jgi:transcriptional regulator with XRE-family HTH domain